MSETSHIEALRDASQMINTAVALVAQKYFDQAELCIAPAANLLAGIAEARGFSPEIIAALNEELAFTADRRFPWCLQVTRVARDQSASESPGDGALAKSNK